MDEIIEAFEKIESLGHGDGCGRGFTCADIAEKALPQPGALSVLVLFPGILHTLFRSRIVQCISCPLPFQLGGCIYTLLIA